MATEADGVDELPPDLRAHVLRHDGSYRVLVLPKNKLSTLSVLREAYGMSLQDAADAFRLLRGAFRSGVTKAEAQRIANTFPAEVAETLVEKEEPAAPDDSG